MITFAGYIMPLCFGLGMSFLAMIYILTPGLLEETVTGPASGGRTNLKQILKGFYTLIKVNTNGRRWTIIGFCAVIVFSVLHTKSMTALVMLYGMGEPFCWTPLEVSYYTIIVITSPMIGMLIGGALLPRIIDDYWIMQLSLWSVILVCMMTGFANSTLLIYIAAGIGFLKSLNVPVIRAQLSKVAEEHETGLMLAFAGCMDSVSEFLAPILANSVYSATVFFYPPFVFFFKAVLMLIPVTITGLLQYKNRISVSYEPLKQPPDHATVS